MEATPSTPSDLSNPELRFGVPTERGVRFPAVAGLQDPKEKENS